MATALAITQTSAVAIMHMEVMNVIHMIAMAVAIGVIGAGGEEIATMIEGDMEATTIAMMDMVEVLMEVETEVAADMEGVITEAITTSRQRAFKLNVLFS